MIVTLASGQLGARAKGGEVEAKDTAAGKEYLRMQPTCEHTDKGHGPECGRRATHVWDMGITRGRYFFALCETHWRAAAPQIFKQEANRV